MAKKRPNRSKNSSNYQNEAASSVSTASEEVERVEAEQVDSTAFDSAEAEALKAEKAKLEEELASQKDQFLRMAAEYDNFRKRTEKEKLQTYDNAIASAVEAFLPVVDNFALALASDAEVSDDFRKGLELIQKKLEGAFEKLHVSSFGERGDKFDPEYHNAISRVDDPEIEEDHIVSVYQKGYIIGDKIIRHAMVQIAN